MQFLMTYDKTVSNSTFEISRKKVLIKKTIALAVLAVVILVSIVVVRHYFYLLDSYYYSAEFHVNFLKNNLRNANIELFADYFKSLQTIPKIFSMILLAYFIQNFWILFSKPILVSAITSAVGLPQSVALNYISLLLTGFLSFGLGIFLLGDIIPFFLKKKNWLDVSASRKFIACGIAGTLFAIPILPVIIPAFLSALMRIRIAPMLMIMIAGFMTRLFLMISLPYVFI